MKVMQLKFIKTLLFLLLLLLFSCNYMKTIQRISPEGDLPEKFSQENLRVDFSENQESSKWWEKFNSPELNSLINKALSDNFTIKQAWARLRQSNALAIQNRSSLYPDLSFLSETSHTKKRIKHTGTQSNQDHSISLYSNYEVDLWGKISSTNQAATLEAEASKEDLHATAITIAANITNLWLNIISKKMEKKLLEKQLQTSTTYLELVELRFRKAMASALDVYQQREAVAKVKASIPLVEADIKIFMHELCLLVGEPANAIKNINTNIFPALDNLPCLGIPSTLLYQRPDIRAALLKLYAADWRIAGAKADMLPAFKLTVGAGYDSEKIRSIFDNWILNLAANLTAPIFDGHKRKSEVKRLEAVADENLAEYKHIVLTAIKEVEDALIMEKKQKKHIKGLRLQVLSAKKALNEAKERYIKGMDYYLPVLTELLAVQSLEIELIQKKNDLLTSRVDLYRALGGTWMQTLLEDNTKDIL